ncbi:unnamed protein product, partial [Discosporangium mesarthrocarpum]
RGHVGAEVGGSPWGTEAQTSSSAAAAAMAVAAVPREALPAMLAACFALHYSSVQSSAAGSKLMPAGALSSSVEGYDLSDLPLRRMLQVSAAAGAGSGAEMGLGGKGGEVGVQVYSRGGRGECMASVHSVLLTDGLWACPELFCPARLLGVQLGDGVAGVGLGAWGGSHCTYWGWGGEIGLESGMRSGV